MTLLLVTVGTAYSKDCSVSRTFQITQLQALSGVLEDPAGATLSGIELELLSEKQVVRHTRTNNQGVYEFGEIPLGRYRIRLRSGENLFCAPEVQCRAGQCFLKPRLRLNQKNSVTMD
jgi:hypothetical protein